MIFCVIRYHSNRWHTRTHTNSSHNILLFLHHVIFYDKPNLPNSMWINSQKMFSSASYMIHMWSFKTIGESNNPCVSNGIIPDVKFHNTAPSTMTCPTTGVGGPSPPPTKHTARVEMLDQFPRHSSRPGSTLWTSRVHAREASAECSWLPTRCARTWESAEVDEPPYWGSFVADSSVA